jgi:hypothetical protein
MVRPAALAALVAALALEPVARAAPGPPLRGQTRDFTYDGRDVGHPERAYRGRVFVPALTATRAKQRPVPLVVFIHGTNAEAIDFRWMGGGREGDVRRIVAALVEGKRIEPVVVAAPSATLPSAIVNAHTSWPAFDLDRFVSLTVRELEHRRNIKLPMPHDAMVPLTLNRWLPRLIGPPEEAGAD